MTKRQQQQAAALSRRNQRQAALEQRTLKWNNQRFDQLAKLRNRNDVLVEIASKAGVQPGMVSDWLVKPVPDFVAKHINLAVKALLDAKLSAELVKLAEPVPA